MSSAAAATCPPMTCAFILAWVMRKMQGPPKSTGPPAQKKSSSSQRWTESTPYRKDMGSQACSDAATEAQKMNNADRGLGDQHASVLKFPPTSSPAWASGLGR